MVVARMIVRMNNLRHVGFVANSNGQFWLRFRTMQRIEKVSTHRAKARRLTLGVGSLRYGFQLNLRWFACQKHIDS